LKNMSTPKLQIKLDAKFSVEKAHAMQLRLSKLIIREDKLPKTISYVAGVDTTYHADVSIGAAVVLDYKSLCLVESKKVTVKTRFPYIPTLLSFREIPPTLAAIKKLKTQPDVFLVDGQGIAHPYRLGFASHLGLILDKPTIGIAKSLLCGTIGAFNPEGWAPIFDNDEVIGGAVAQKREKPIYVSIGHKVSLEKAIAIVKHCRRLHRIPEPIRTAHTIANEEREKQRAK